MRLVYPPNHHHTFEESTFFVGSAHPKSTVTVNHQVVIPLSSQGFFAWRVPLAGGINEFYLQERKETGETEGIKLAITRTPSLSLEAIPEQPDGILPFAFPSENIGIHAGESLMLCCPAPKGSKVLCRIDMLMSRAVEMIPVGKTPDNRAGCFAQLHQPHAPWPDAELFVAQLHIPANTPSLSDLAVYYVLLQEERKLEFRAAGAITILPLGKRSSAVVLNPESPVRVHSDNGARRTPLLTGTVMQTLGFSGQSIQVRYGPNESVWVDRQDIWLQEQPIYPAWTPIHLIQTSVLPGAFQVIIPLSRLVPMDVTLETEQILLRLYGASSQCDFIHYQKGVFEKGLRQITWTQVNSEVMEIKIALDSRLCGFQRDYNPQMQAIVCSVRTACSNQASPFILMLDPGHGGDEAGAMAPDGTREKDLNLLIGLEVQKRLSKVPNLKVMLTRERDESVSLENRVKCAVESKADLLISLHHNALPDGRNPLHEHGISTYHYYPYALPFAKAMQEALLKGTEFSDYGVLYDSLHLCRIMQMPSLLLELGFLTHPEDSRRCLHAQHQSRVADAICKGVQSCLVLLKP